MTNLLVRLTRLEIILAVHLETLGGFWAARAASRLGKISGTLSGEAR